MKGLLINLDENEVLEVMIDDNNTLNDITSAISCDTIDVVRDVNIGKRKYDIIVDDNGLFKDNPRPSARCMDAEQVLFGSIIVVNADNEKGTWHSLTDDDIENIHRHIYAIQDKETGDISPLLEYTYTEPTDFEV